MNKSKLKNNQTIEGTIHIINSGSAFLKTSDEYEDIFIYKDNLNNAFQSDTVLCRVRNGKFGKFEADVIEITKRYKNTFIGSLQKSHGRLYITPDDKNINTSFLISNPPKSNKKDKFLIEVLEYSPNPRAKIIKNIGKSGNHQTEMVTIMNQFNVDSDFAEEVELEASKISYNLDKELKKRLDYRDVCTVAIDPKDCKDRDDSLSYKELENGKVEIGVHIADVSYFVQKGSKLDKEAYTRGNSSYLVDRVIPMLPEVLSNNICSLNENEDKLAFSFIFTYDKDFNLIDKKFTRTVINMNRAMSYEDAQYIIDNDLDSNEIEHSVNRLNILAKFLRSKREIIELSRCEVQFELDVNNNHKPIGITIKKSLEANKMIEEFMLLANRKVGDYLTEKKRPCIYRSHDTPDYDKLCMLSVEALKFGHKLNIDIEDNIIKNMNQLLENVKGEGSESLINILVSKTLPKANCKIDKKDHGHFGLSMKNYAWVTSPIRRYADLMNHRFLTEVLENEKFNYKNEELEKICSYINSKEIDAQRAERESIKYKQVEYMNDRIGQTFKATITGMSNFGIFCEITDNMCQGMISKNTLFNSDFHIDVENNCIESSIFGEYKLGDELTVKVVRCSLLEKEIEFSPIF